MTALVVVALLCQSTPVYTVAGRVVDGVTGAPIAKAHVTLSRSNAAPMDTGPDGRFSFPGLPAGKYSLGVQRSGYVNQAFGQRAIYERFSSAIVTGENQSTEDLVFRLIPSAVVSGVITDMRGDPVAGMIVHAEQISGSGLRRRVIRVFPGSTDDRGYYRIPSLMAGTVAVVVAGRPFSGLEIATVEPSAYPRTFYPGTTDPDQAVLLRLKPGAETRADMVLRPVPVGRIIGTMPKASPERSVYALISTPSMLQNEIAMAPNLRVAGGRFTFDRVPAGRYLLTLVDDTTTRKIIGRTEVVVTTGDVNVTLAEPPFPRVTFHVAVAGVPKTPAASRLAHLQALDGGASFVQPVAADGSAVIQQTVPGKYEVSVTQGVQLAITSLKATGAAVYGMRLDVADLPVDLELTVDAGARDFTGHLWADGKPKSGALVMLAQRDGWQYTAAYRIDQTDSDGSFLWVSVPPGDYLMFAFDSGLPDDYDDPDTIRRMLPIAQPLRVTGDAAQTAELKLLPIPSDR